MERDLDMTTKVLITDDSEFMRNMLRSILMKAGFVVAGEANNGAEAVQKYQDLKPDMVVMDIDMPGIGGIEAVKQIRSLDPQAKLVMCSARKEFFREAIVAGANGFIVKPFKASQVLETLSKVK